MSVTLSWIALIFNPYGGKFLSRCTSWSSSVGLIEFSCFECLGPCFFSFCVFASSLFCRSLCVFCFVWDSEIFESFSLVLWEGFVAICSKFVSRNLLQWNPRSLLIKRLRIHHCLGRAGTNRNNWGSEVSRNSRRTMTIQFKWRNSAVKVFHCTLSNNI